MPRNTPTAKPKDKGAWPDVLRFIAALLFLYVVFTGAGANPPFGNAWLNGAGSLWVPILFGVAVLGSIGLFFSSLAGALSSKCRMGGMVGKLLMFTSLALVILTASPAWNVGFWIVIVGFLIGWIGSAMQMM
ncbi:MAG: hypothetical protein ABR981_00955 [Candidatus Micrarchaeaceae archaeon]|jgi:hypothetical protein